MNGGSYADREVAAAARHRLYRNNGNGKFKDTTSSSGIVVSEFGMGACSADYDNDGWVDLYVTGVGSNKLYRNSGGKGFQDVSEKPVRRYRALELQLRVCRPRERRGRRSLCDQLRRLHRRQQQILLGGQNIRTYCHPNVYKAFPTSFTATTETARSQTSVKNPAFTGLTGTDSELFSETMTTMDGRTSTSPTTPCRIFYSVTKGKGFSKRSVSGPASRSAPKDGRWPEWEQTWQT